MLCYTSGSYPKTSWDYSCSYTTVKLSLIHISFIRNDREVLKVPACVHTQLFKDYYDALTHGIASQFGIWRYQKR